MGFTFRKRAFAIVFNAIFLPCNGCTLIGSAVGSAIPRYREVSPGISEEGDLDGPYSKKKFYGTGGGEKRQAERPAVVSPGAPEPESVTPAESESEIAAPEATEPDRIQQLIAQGDMHAAAGANWKAIRYYRDALQIDPDNEQARARLKAAFGYAHDGQKLAADGSPDGVDSTWDSDVKPRRKRVGSYALEGALVGLALDVTVIVTVIVLAENDGLSLGMGKFGGGW